MAEIVPFRGIRYAASKGRALGQLLAPPYDLVSQEQRDELLRRSPHNVVHLTLGEERQGDSAATNKYTRAAEYWRAWLAQGVLQRDPAPAFYPLEQSFWSPDGRSLRRRGCMAAVRLHEFREGVIVPHEKTLVAPKADRLEILKNVRANLSLLRTGKVKGVRFETLAKLCDALECSPGDLLGFEKSETRPALSAEGEQAGDV